VAAQAEECSFNFVSPGMRLILCSVFIIASLTTPPCLPRSHGDLRTCRDIYDCGAAGSCALVRKESLPCTSFTLRGMLSSSGSAIVAVGDPARKIGDPDPERSLRQFLPVAMFAANPSPCLLSSHHILIIGETHTVCTRFSVLLCPIDCQFNYPSFQGVPPGAVSRSYVLDLTLLSFIFSARFASEAAGKGCLALIRIFEGSVGIRLLRGVISNQAEG
jgi:hypothetical protein